MQKKSKFDKELRDLAEFARVISHPARLAILKYLAETRTCISGDISDQLPLSRSTVSRHLKELRDSGLIHGSIDGVKVNYCLCSDGLDRFAALFSAFFDPVRANTIDCETGTNHENKEINY